MPPEDEMAGRVGAAVDAARKAKDEQRTMACKHSETHEVRRCGDWFHPFLDLVSIATRELSVRVKEGGKWGSASGWRKRRGVRVSVTKEACAV